MFEISISPLSAKTFDLFFGKKQSLSKCTLQTQLTMSLIGLMNKAIPEKTIKADKTCLGKNCPKLTTGSKFDCAEAIIIEKKAFFKSTNFTNNNKSRIFQQFPFFHFFCIFLFLFHFVANFLRYRIPQTNSSYLPALF